MFSQLTNQMKHFAFSKEDRMWDDGRSFISVKHPPHVRKNKEENRTGVGEKDLST